MKEFAYVLKGAKSILVPKEGLVRAIKVVKNFALLCVGTGGLYAITEHLRSSQKDAFTEMKEEAGAIGNLIKNNLDRD